MSKRILSLCLALAILLVALPVLPISNTEANAAAPGEANPVFTPSQLPETVVDRAITNFEEPDAKVGETNCNGTRYDKNFKAYTYRSGATTVVDSIVDGGFKVEYTAFSTANYPTTHIFIDPALGLNPTTETTALQFHIDTTGMDSASVGTESAFRFTLTTSNGTSGVSDKLFVIDNKTWYFLPDATEENPNPEMITRVTRNTNSVWNAYLDIPNGVKGTVILPIDAFIFDENSKMTNYTKGWTDWEEYITANIEMILCGHLSCPDIVTKVDKGVNGNDVLQVLMDVQNLELNAETPVAMVGLATYNADGSIVSFKYVSTSGYRTETGEGACFFDDNSNELKFNLSTATAPYVDKSVDNSANIEADGLFNGGIIIRDFEDTFTTGSLWWGSSNINGSKFDFMKLLHMRKSIFLIYHRAKKKSHAQLLI